jgi:hypothetical protein
MIKAFHWLRIKRLNAQLHERMLALRFDIARTEHRLAMKLLECNQ